MKILNDDLVSNVSSSAGALNSTRYPISNVKNEVPGLPYIANASTCELTVTVASGMQALFLQGLQADSANLTIHTSGGDGYSDISTTPFSSLYELGIGMSHLIPPEWFNFTILDSGGTFISSPYSGGTLEGLVGAPTTLELSGGGTTTISGGMLVLGLDEGENYISNTDSGTALGAATIRIYLSSTTNRKTQGADGSGITNWFQSSGVSGYFGDGYTPVNLNAHGNIFLGSIVTISGVEYQISKIIGDGSAASSVELSSAVGSASVSSIVNPIKLGSLRAGTTLSVEAPQMGMAQNLTDYSIRQPLANGGYTQTPRNVGRTFAASWTMTDSNARAFESFYYAYRSKCFPAIMAADMGASTEPTTRLSGYLYFQGPPSFSFLNKTGSHSTVSATFRENI